MRLLRVLRLLNQGKDLPSRALFDIEGTQLLLQGAKLAGGLLNTLRPIVLADGILVFERGDIVSLRLRQLRIQFLRLAKLVCAGKLFCSQLVLLRSLCRGVLLLERCFFRGQIHELRPGYRLLIQQRDHLPVIRNQLLRVCNLRIQLLCRLRIIPNGLPLSAQGINRPERRDLLLVQLVGVLDVLAQHAVSRHRPIQQLTRLIHLGNGIAQRVKTLAGFCE